MDLEVKEVSELLNVPEQTLLEWIKEGKIPAYSIRDRYRFNRQEIENWLLKQKNGTSAKKPSSLKGHQHFNLYRAVHKGDVFIEQAQKTKEELFTHISKKIASKLKLDPEILTEHLLEREALAPTALGSGFAIPHARDLLLKPQHDVVTVVFLETPIDYGALDREPVHTLFFLLASDDKKHLALLSKLAHLVQTPPLRELLARRPQKKTLLTLIKEWEAALA